MITSPFAAPSSSARRTLRASDVASLLAKYLPSAATAPAPAPRNLELYQRALVHRSYVVANRGDAQTGSYERLEFLGDAVLGLAVAAYLYARYPGEDEGFMTRMRTKLVNGRMLSELCRTHTTLPSFVACAWAAPTGPDASTCEDVLEAFIGATFLDLGYETAARWVVGLLEATVDFAELVACLDSAKTVLNRHCMQTQGFLPEMNVLAEGFVRLVTPTGAVIATGKGASLKEAEDAAVRNAIAYYNLGRR
jgi:ribonuclease-3